MPRTLASTPTLPARAPEGRFHHAGQTAVYASLSEAGAAVAIQMYLGDGVARAVVPMWLDAQLVRDERGNRDASIVWQGIRAAGDPFPTWAFSDAARTACAQAMLYSSRTRPELSHVVVFQPDCLTFLGPISDFSPGSGLQHQG